MSERSRALLAHKGAEGDVTRVRDLYHQRGGGRVGGDELNARARALAHHLQAQAARDGDSAALRLDSTEQAGAYSLVQGVVPSHVLGEGDDISAVVEHGGCVRAPARLEDLLAASKLVVDRPQNSGRDLEGIPCGGQRNNLLLEAFAPAGSAG